MSIIIASTGIAIGGALAYGGVRKRKKFRGTFGESTLASNFAEMVWPYTALRIGMVGNRSALRSELPKTPEIVPFGDSEFTGYGFDVLITVPGGRTASKYSGLEENIQTLLRVDRVDPARSTANGHQISYRVYETLPTDNLQKLWNWDPSLATNSAVAMALGMGQTELAYVSAAVHTMWVGLSGGGKSSVFSALFQNMAADPTVEIWAADGKPGGGDVKTWGHLCHRFAFGGGPAGDLAIFKLIGDFVESYQNQQGEIPKDKKQFVPRGSKIGPDDIEATEERPTKFLIIDEYNLVCDAIRNYLSAKAKDTIKIMAEEIGYDRNPMDDLASILNGARSSNHWLHAVGQNPLATEWLHKKLFQAKGALKLDAPTLNNFFAGSPADREAARIAWESSVDRLSPADWKKPQAGFIMVGDKDGNWQKLRMYYSEANDLLRLRKAGLHGSPLAVNHQIGNSAPWSVDLSSTPVAVGFSEKNLITNSPKATTPSAEMLEAEALAEARAKDLQRPERAEWIIAALREVKQSGNASLFDESLEILRSAGVHSFKQLQTEGASAKLWRQIEAHIYPASGEVDELLATFEDDTFSSVGVSEWEINLQNNELIVDEDELEAAISQLHEHHPKLRATTVRKISQIIAGDLARNGRTSYQRVADALKMTQDKEGEL